MLTCPHCKNHNIKLTGYNFQCEDCNSFTLGVIWTPEITISLNASHLGVTVEQYKELSLLQGNNIDKCTIEYNNLKVTIGYKGE